MSERTVRWALDAALAKLDKNPLDQAAVALARRYASDIDKAAKLSVAADKLAREIRPYLDDRQYDRLVAQFARIDETAVLGLLGPKLVQVLAELGMTARARADVTGKGGGGSEPPRNDLAEWRAERNKRLNTP